MTSLLVRASLICFFLCLRTLSQTATAPLPPDLERQTFRFADSNLDTELVAAEPAVISPVAVAWDEKGRLFVAEMNDYPLEPQGGQIRMLESPNNEGKYLKSTVFAEHLPFPTSVLPWNGGLLVTAAPDLLFLKDTNGDGKSDERRVLFTGFGEGNQQLRVNGLRIGLDNWVYGANGRSDGLIHRPEAQNPLEVSLRGHDFRFKPNTGEFQPLAGRSQFGTAIDDWGHRFLSWNTIPIRQVVIEESYLNRNPHLATVESLEDLLPAGDDKRVFPITPPPLVFNEESSSHFNALAGLTIYRGDTLGKDPAGQMYHGNAFIGESLRNLVHRRVLKENGTSFLAVRGELGQEFVAASDPWFHPVNFATGPDGAFYIVDFYRRFVEHPHYVHDQSVVGKVPWREGAGHGRIWRVYRKGVPQNRALLDVRLHSTPSAELTAQLGHENGWTRDTVQRLLIERHDKSVIPLLRKVAINPRQSPEARVHALWTLQGVDGLDILTLRSVLASNDFETLENAIRLAEPIMGNDAEIRAALLKAAESPSPRVRLALSLAVGSIPNSDDLRKERLTFLRELALRTHGDKWLIRGISTSAGPDTWALVNELKTRIPGILDRQHAELLPLLASLVQLVGMSELASDQTALLEWLIDSDNTETSESEMILLSELSTALTRRNLTLSEALSGITNVSKVRRFSEITATNALGIALTKDAPPKLRVSAIQVASDLAKIRSIPSLIELLGIDSPPAVQIASAQSLARIADQKDAKSVFARWNLLPRGSRMAIVAECTRSSALAMALLEAINDNLVTPLEVNGTTRQSLLQSSSPKVREEAKKAFAHLVPTDRLEIIQKFEAAFKLEGNRKSGGELFGKTCLICHSVKGRGANVGPDLSAVGTRPKESLLVDILDPSRSVSPDFLSYTIKTEDSETITGLLIAETATQLSIRRAQLPDETIARTRIKEIHADGKSLMPDGLEQGMNLQGIADLLEFLRTPDPALIPAE